LWHPHGFFEAKLRVLSINAAQPPDLNKYAMLEQTSCFERFIFSFNKSLDAKMLLSSSITTGIPNRIAFAEEFLLVWGCQIAFTQTD